MKKLVIISFLMLLFSGSTTIVHATLSVGSFSGIEYVYDNVSNLTWHRDLGVYVNMDYDTQVAGINALSTLPGLGAWQLASTAQVDALLDQGEATQGILIWEMFLPSFSVEMDPNQPGYDPLWHGWGFLGRTNTPEGGYLHSAMGIYIDALGYTPTTDNLLTYSGGPFGVEDNLASEFFGAWAVAQGEVNVNPVPEPSTCLLLGMGLLGMAGYGWRRKRK